jgi:diguanylate cyclase (GGDEF)-like protein/PAS domain S-box-containing protein
MADLWRELVGDRRAPHPLGPEQERTILERSIRNCNLLAGLSDIAHAAALAMTGLFFVPDATGTFRPVWTLVSVAFALWCSWRCLDRCRAGAPPPTRGDLWRLRAQGVTWSVLHGLFLWRSIPLAETSEHLWLLATISGIIASGAVVLAAERSVGLVWLWGHALFVGGAFASTGEHTWLVMTLLLLLFTAALTVATVYLAEDFALRCRAEMAADAERAVVRLLLDDFEDGARDWLWQVDAEGRLRSVSAQFARCAGRTVAGLEGRRLLDVLRSLGTARLPHGAEALDRLERALSSDEVVRDLAVPVQRTGELRWWSLSGRRTDEGPSRWRGVCADVTEERRAIDEVHRQASLDPLTGLGNRRRLSASLAERSAERAGDDLVALAIIDLDDFKLVNDSSGHGMGDVLLRQVADRLAAVDPADECLRLGGDEFAVVLAAGPDHGALLGRIDRYVATLRGPMTLGGTRYDVRGSCGYATLPGDTTNPEDLLTYADLALYAAKDGGGDAVRRFDLALLEAANARSTAVRALGRSVAAGEFEVWYQPQLDLATEALTSFEALVRWRHPTLGLVGPATFVPYAEEAGLIVPLGQLVLEEALRFASSIPDHLQVAVNLSPVQLRSVGFADTFGRALEQAGVPVERIEVEVTESAVLEAAARRELERLRALGVAIALDDFGTGYSSLARLRDLPVDTIKVDRSFVIALADDASDPSKVLVRSVVEMAAALAMRTVAEGVETAEQARIVRSLGCDRGQGYLWGRPMPEGDARALARVAVPAAVRSPPAGAG